MIMLHKDVSKEIKAVDPIKHVIVLMMENKSYDQMLGSIKKIKPDTEGVDENLNFNLDYKGNKIYQRITTEKQMNLDPIHEVPDVLKQIFNNNSGFIQDFVSNYPNSSAEDRQNVMGYYPLGFLPALHALATEYTVCDHWFASVPGPTWTNRFFAMSGTSSGRVKMPEDMKHPELNEIFYQTQKSIFDRLNEKNISWRSYVGDFPISLVLTHNREPDNLINYRSMNDFYKDAKGPAEHFPEFSFIEPRYLGENQNDDHPPHNTMKAEKLIADTYNAIRSNEALWKQSLLIVVYDEHGGFYDHVNPPAAVPPDDYKEEGYNFTQLGVRVPAILISPWVKKSVEKTVFDHTSVLKYLSDKWDLGPLGNRTKNANSIATALDFNDGPRNNCLSSIKIHDSDLISDKPYLEKHNENGNHKAIHSFAGFLNKKNPAQIPPPAEVSSVVVFEDKVGAILEKYGAVRLGMWFRSNADTYRKERIVHTLKVIDHILGKSHNQS